MTVRLGQALWLFCSQAVLPCAPGRFPCPDRIVKSPLLSVNGNMELYPSTVALAAVVNSPGITTGVCFAEPLPDNRAQTECSWARVHVPAAWLVPLTWLSPAINNLQGPTRLPMALKSPTVAPGLRQGRTSFSTAQASHGARQEVQLG